MVKKADVPRAIVLLTAIALDSGAYWDGGSTLIVGEDVSAARAGSLIEAGYAVAAGPQPDDVLDHDLAIG